MHIPESYGERCVAMADALHTCKERAGVTSFELIGGSPNPLNRRGACKSMSVVNVEYLTHCLHHNENIPNAKIYVFRTMATVLSVVREPVVRFAHLHGTFSAS